MNLIQDLANALKQLPECSCGKCDTCKGLQALVGLHEHLSQILTNAIVARTNFPPLSNTMVFSTLEAKNALLTLQKLLLQIDPTLG